MSENYISQFYTWATGNTITAPRLNGNVSNVTDGLSSGVKAVNIGKVLIGGTETINSSRNGIFNGITLSSDINTISNAIDWDLIDNTASALSFDATGKTGLLEFDTTDGAEGLKTSGFLRLGSDASTLTDVGALVLGASNDSGLFFNGTDLTIQTDGAGASGIIFDSEDDTFEFKGSGTLQATFDTTGLNLVSGDVFKINGTSVLSNDTLGSDVVNTSITSTGALNSGSITSGFGNIDVGSSNIDGGTITGSTALVGTLSTASQPNITAVGTLSSLVVSGDVSVDTDTFKVDSTNNFVGIRTATPSSLLHLATSGGSTILTMQRTNTNTTGSIGDIIFNASDNHTVAGIRALGDGNNEGAHLLFGTTSTASGNGFSTINEQMRITSEGDLNLGNASTSSNGMLMFHTGQMYMYADGTGTQQQVRFYRNVDSSASLVGWITTTGSTTSYSSASDYRLKENVTPIIDGITRIMKLKPSQFNFINYPKTKVDGFLAHEVQEVVPEAVTGQKDDVDEEGKPEYQGIDQSKIVPLLVAAFQELVKKVEILENK